MFSVSVRLPHKKTYWVATNINDFSEANRIAYVWSRCHPLVITGPKGKRHARITTYHVNTWCDSVKVCGYN